MKQWPVFIILSCVLFFSCEKNTVSKIPHISLNGSWPDVIKTGYDTAFVQFAFADGDADVGVDTVSAVYIKDNRFDSAGYVKYEFPDIDAAIEDPKKGLTGTATVLLLLPPPAPRSDTLHTLHGDTTTFELYMTDRANNQSNHITTSPLIIRP